MGKDLSFRIISEQEAIRLKQKQTKDSDSDSDSGYDNDIEGFSRRLNAYFMDYIVSFNNLKLEMKRCLEENEYDSYLVLSRIFQEIYNTYGFNESSYIVINYN